MSPPAPQASLREMIAPGLLVILTPVVVGVLCGIEAVAGLLTGIFSLLLYYSYEPASEPLHISLRYRASPLGFTDYSQLDALGFSYTSVSFFLLIVVKC